MMSYLMDFDQTFLGGGHGWYLIVRSEKSEKKKF